MDPSIHLDDEDDEFRQDYDIKELEKISDEETTQDR